MFGSCIIVHLHNNVNFVFQVSFLFHQYSDIIMHVHIKVNLTFPNWLVGLQ